MQRLPLLLLEHLLRLIMHRDSGYIDRVSSDSVGRHTIALAASSHSYLS